MTLDNGTFPKIGADLAELGLCVDAVVPTCEAGGRLGAAAPPAPAAALALTGAVLLGDAIGK